MLIRILFIGDVVGEAGLGYLERWLPAIIHQENPHFVVANAENIATTAGLGHGSCGMTPAAMNRLFALGVDIATGGNHSWDGPCAVEVHRDHRIIRPLNFSLAAPGRGAALIEKDGVRLGVLNAVSRTAMPQVDHPLDAIEELLHAWDGQTDAILIDFHGESVTEKLTCAYALDGRVTALLGTHTHVPTMDARILPGGTAYLSDVGMTGPGDGIQGYQPDLFVNAMRLRMPTGESLRESDGVTEFGAVMVTCSRGRAVRIERLPALEAISLPLMASA